MASFSGFHKRLDSQDNKVITSATYCAGLNWFVIQSTSSSLYISILADTGDQCIFIVILNLPVYFWNRCFFRSCFQ